MGSFSAILNVEVLFRTFGDDVSPLSENRKNFQPSKRTVKNRKTFESGNPFAHLFDILIAVF